MKKILWVSLRVPYDTVPDAGGKVENYYIKKIHASDLFNVYLISICMESEYKNVDLEKYGIGHSLVLYKEDLLSKVFREVENLPRKLNCRSYAGGILTRNRERRLLREMKQYKATERMPEIIVLQWTEIAILLPVVKKIFPLSKIVCIEEDVAYQGIGRKRDFEKNMIRKYALSCKYKMLKRAELDVLRKCDLVVVNNFKDREMLLAEGICKEKIFRACPYYEEYYRVKRSCKTNRIVYFGAMGRPENEKSVVWFIDNVFSRLGSKYELWIVGSNPSKKICEYISDNIIVTGFVGDVKPVFADALCLVAPLVLGAGIKIKVLEAMSAGIPVLTNDIGIEGIGAKKGKDYMHCENPDEYIAALESIRDVEMNMHVGENGRRFVKDNFDKQDRIEKFIKRIETLQ